MTGRADKDLFECSYPEWQENRVSSTFWDDFTIADAFGANAVRDTFRRAFGEWKSNYKMLTELVMVLNHKIWRWHGIDEDMAKLYDGLWKQADGWATDNLKGPELEHFTMVTD